MINTIDLRNAITSSDWVRDPFEVLSAISRVSAKNEALGREFVIRALDHREELENGYGEILNELAITVGLHPYVNELEPLSMKGALIHASNNVEGIMDGYVLHASQSKVLRYLMAGESVVLSAPTSFGKSLLIDVVISISDFANVVLILPTLALVEETRRRMSRFSEFYTVITSSDQSPTDRNIFVLTQERYLAMQSEIPGVDFFAIDEFYKLSIADDGARSTQLNQALLSLLRTGAQFYMLGPSIRAIPDFAQDRLNCRFLVEDFQTVAIELHALSKRPNKPESLASLLDTTTEPTLVYCQSPASTRRLIKKYLEIRELPETDDEEILEAAEWTSRNYHSEWLISKALRHGIGIHHGKLPRALGRFMIRAFEDQKLRILLCTSTLIEGVNTAAKNVVVFDNKIGGNTQPLDFFTFNNIRGRSGRMFKHFVGHVYYFEEPPQEELPFVDMPAINPTEKTPSSLLIQMEEESIPISLRDKYDSFRNSDVIPFDLMKSFSGIEPEYLLSTADYLMSLGTSELQEFSWTRPDYDDIGITSSVIWEQMGGAGAARMASLRSHKMMTFWVWRLYVLRNVAKFRNERINNQIEEWKISPDEAVESVLAFLRGWASFNYPKYLAALSEVSNIVLQKRGFKGCNYLPFAVAIEHLFQPNSFSTLEEYGLPSEISDLLLKNKVFRAEDDIGDVIRNLKRPSIRRYAENTFEKNIIEDFQKGIGLNDEA